MQHLNKILLSVAVLTGIAGIAAWTLGDETSSATTAAYKVAKVERGEIAAIVSATGTLNPVNAVQVGSQVSGTIQHLRSDFNQRVRKGDVIAQIDPAVFRAKLAEADASLKTAEAAAKKAEVGVREAKRELDRQTNLHGKKLVAETVMDAARFAHDAALVELELRQAAVAQAHAARERERVNLDYTTIIAPIDGVVISRDVDVGQTVAASLQAPTLFTIARDLTKMQVEADVDEAYIGQVKEGQRVRFSVFAYPGRSFYGEVGQIRLQPNVDSGVVKYNTIIRVDNPDLALKPGMTATISILIASRENALKVPDAALRFVPDISKERVAELRRNLAPDEHVIWTVEDDSLRPVTVTSGIVGPRQVEVLNDALREGMTVALPGTHKTEKQARFGLSLF